MERRTFLKGACGLCGLATAGSALSFLSACATSKISKVVAVNHTLTIPLSKFEIDTLQIIRTDTWDYDIAVKKQNQDSFVALSLKCTHFDEPLTNTGKGFVCNLHGSLFGLDGTVLQGPAQKPLQRLKTIVKNENLIVYLKS